MKESIWGYLVLIFGMICIVFIFFMQSASNTDQHNFTLLRETCKGAMYDAVDKEEYRENKTIRIDREKFVELFIRRFAENANLSKKYKIDIMDVNEIPPKVSIRISSVDGTTGIQNVEFKITNRIDAILEAK